MKKIRNYIASIFLFIHFVTSLAADKIDVNNKNMLSLQNYLGLEKTYLACQRYGGDHCHSLQINKKSKDFNGTSHIRARQMFAGYPVWGGDIILHLAGEDRNSNSANMNGFLYQNIEKDLSIAQAYLFTKERRELALQKALETYEHKNGAPQNVHKEKSELIVYIDEQQKAHWAFHVNFYVFSNSGMPALPNYILDASSFTTYRSWDEVKMFSSLGESHETVKGGGYGGNLRSGKVSYDDLKGYGHFPALNIERDDHTKICYLATDNFVVKTFNTDSYAHFPCITRDPAHNNLYWDSLGDEVNGGYSPNHDALFAAQMTESMFKSWYQLPILTDEQTQLPIRITLMTHPSLTTQDIKDEDEKPNLDTAFYDEFNHAVYLGDGLYEFYPLASIDVIAHELAHAFTEQHSSLVLDGQSGGINESFSDMTAKAVEFFVNGSNHWDIGSAIKKTAGKATRYMDKPSKDCEGKENIAAAFTCSIDDVSAYHPYLLVHQTSGIFNRVFYLIANQAGWDTRKAFNIMLKANMDYWLANTDFEHAACGVLKAALDYHYDLQAVRDAFTAVKIDTSRC